MSFRPHWRQGAIGCYPIIYNARSVCCYCKGDLRKLHGLNRDGNGGYQRDAQGNYFTMAWFLFGAGPFCLHCGEKEAWCNPDFFNHSGSHQYHSSNFDLNRTLRPQMPSIEDEIKKL